MEIWKDIIGFESLYEVSNYGQIRNVKTLRILKFHLETKGYLGISLRKNNKSKRFAVHRLVAIAFIPNPENKPEVNHKDGDKQNNRVDNLEWATAKENTNHSINTGLRKTKLSFEIAEQIRKEFVPFKMTRQQLAIKYKVSLGTVKDIVRNVIWKNEGR